MALDVSGFIIPERKYEGLYKVAETLGAQEIAQTKAAATAAKAAEANKMKLKANLQKMLDPNQNLSGTPADPQILNGFYDALSQGYDLIEGGAQENVVRGVMGNLAKNLNNYSVTAKNAKKIIDDQISSIGGMAGYDKTRLQDLSMKRVFFNDDGTPKDMANISISQSPVLDIVRDYPELVTTNKGIDEWLKNEKPSSNKVSVTKGSRPGKVTKSDIEITAPSWAIPETDDKGIFTGNVVPNYEIAKDGDDAIYIDNQPIRMVTNDIAQSVLTNSPDTADFIRGRVKTHLQEYKDKGGQPLSLNDPRIDMITRAELYKELQNRISKSYKNVTSDVSTTRGGTTINYNYGGQFTSQGETTGNALDEVGTMGKISTKTGNYVENGVLYDASNNPVSGKKELYITVDKLPISLKSVIKAGGGGDLDDLDGVNLVFEDGQITGMKTDYGEIKRDNINNFQLKFNTESVKGQQPTFGAPAKTKKKTTSKKGNTQKGPLDEL